jgi:hypothetical protein
MAKRKSKVTTKYEPATGFGMVVGGPHPYVSRVFYSDLGNPHARLAAESEVSAVYHKVVPVVLLTRSDWRRIQKQLKGAKRAKTKN